MADRLTEEERAVAYGWAEEVRDNPEVGGRFAIPFAARLILELYEENARLRDQLIAHHNPDDGPCFSCDTWGRWRDD